MKNQITVFFILICNLLFAQEQGSLLEIVVQTEGYSNEEIAFQIEPVDNYHTWCTYNVDLDLFIEIVTNSEAGYDTITGNYNGIVNHGFNICSEEQFDKFWLTLNKFTISDDQDTIIFYIDMRDTTYYPGNGNPDITIRFVKNDSAYYKKGLYQGSTANMESISPGDTLKVWEICEYATHSILDYLANITNFDLTLSNGHPKLTWDHEQDANGYYKYEIWRLINSSHIPSGTFTLLTTLNDPATLEYTDTEVSSGSALWAHYKIRAAIDDLKSDFSGIESVEIDDSMQKPVLESKNDFSDLTIFDFKLFDNHPNPFNSTTTISFNLPEECFVKLVVYDNNGKKVATIVNERISKGSYSVKFDGSNLPSGTYIYKIDAGSFSEIKKMQLIK